MENENKSRNLSRRKFLGSTAAVAALTVMPGKMFGSSHKSEEPVVKPGANPNSKFSGVQIGTITYSWRDQPGGVENIIKYCKETGISSVELMSNDLEEYLGAPKNPMMGMFGPPPPPPKNPAGAAQQNPAPPAGGFKRPELTEEQKAAIAKYNTEMKAWRLGLPMSKVESAKKLFDDAGIEIHIVKFSPSRWSDEEIDYAFKVAKAMGAKGVSEEIGMDAVKKMAPFAEKNGLYAIFHQHMQFATPGFDYDQFMAVSPAVRFNFDSGHFFGSTGIHPNTIIEKYHDRIVSIHMKDKTGPKTDPANANQVWGQGETPVADILNLIKEKGWPIYCDIELEYDVKPWSNSVKEVKTCVAYARQILM